MDTGLSIFMIGLLIAAIAMTITTLHFRWTALAFGTVVIWFLAGASFYAQSTSGWDLYYSLFWACMIMTFINAFIVYDILGGGKSKERGIDQANTYENFMADHPEMQGLDQDVVEVFMAQERISRLPKKQPKSKEQTEMEAVDRILNG